MLILGHRGAPREAPENTLESFRLALECGADGVELDVRMTSDLHLVLRHDDGFDDGRAVSTSSLAEVRGLDTSIPTLHDALAALDRAPRVVVEVKPQPGRTDEFAERIAGELGRHRTDTVVVSSFDSRLLRVLRSISGGVRTALLSGIARDSSELAAVLDEAAGAGHAEVHLAHRILRGPLGDDAFTGAAKRDLNVVAWTVNDLDEADRLRERGLSAVITDLPRQMVAALQA